MIKAVIFDFFDVIHQDPQKAWLARHGYERTGGFAEASDLLDLGQIDYTEYLGRYAHHSGIEAETVHRQFAEYARVDKEVVRIINDLKAAGYRRALLSNAHGDEIRPLLEKYNLEELFDHIVISAEVGMKKPDPGIFLLALQRLRVCPEEAIFVDDTPHNVEAAERVGIHGIHHRGDTPLKPSLIAAGVSLTPT